MAPAIVEDETGKSGRPARGNAVVTWGAVATALTFTGLITTGAWSILSWQYTENNRLRAELSALQVQVVKDTVTRPELREVIKEFTARLEKRLDTIESKLNNGR